MAEVVKTIRVLVLLLTLAPAALAGSTTAKEWTGTSWADATAKTYTADAVTVGGSGENAYWVLWKDGAKPLKIWESDPTLGSADEAALNAAHSNGHRAEVVITDTSQNPPDNNLEITDVTELPGAS